METFDRGKFVDADFTRGKVMLASFFLSAFVGFLVGLQTSTLIGMLLLFVVLIIALILVSIMESRGLRTRMMDLLFPNSLSIDLISLSASDPVDSS